MNAVFKKAFNLFSLVTVLEKPWFRIAFSILKICNTSKDMIELNSCILKAPLEKTHSFLNDQVFQGKDLVEVIDIFHAFLLRQCLKFLSHDIPSVNDRDFPGSCLAEKQVRRYIEQRTTGRSHIRRPATAVPEEHSAGAHPALLKFAQVLYVKRVSAKAIQIFRKPMADLNGKAASAGQVETPFSKIGRKAV